MFIHSISCIYACNIVHKVVPSNHPMRNTHAHARKQHKCVPDARAVCLMLAALFCVTDVHRARRASFSHRVRVSPAVARQFANTGRVRRTCQPAARPCTAVGTARRVCNIAPVRRTKTTAARVSFGRHTELSTVVINPSPNGITQGLDSDSGKSLFRRNITT